MEQRHKYRGRTWEGKWVCGNPVYLVQENYDEGTIDGIQTSWDTNEDIDPKTVGQYVGAIEVSNGDELTVKVWEGDRVRMSLQHDGHINYDYEIEGVVRYDSSIGRWEVYSTTYQVHEYPEGTTWALYSNDREDLCNITIIGNIHQ